MKGRVGGGAADGFLRILAVMNDGTGDLRLAAEQRARVLIDRQLRDAGWSVQGRRDLNLFASPGWPAGKW